MTQNVRVQGLESPGTTAVVVFAVTIIVLSVLFARRDLRFHSL
jgi:hypothetical protein